MLCLGRRRSCDLEVVVDAEFVRAVMVAKIVLALDPGHVSPSHLQVHSTKRQNRLSSGRSQDELIEKRRQVGITTSMLDTTTSICVIALSICLIALSKRTDSLFKDRTVAALCLYVVIDDQLI